MATHDETLVSLRCCQARWGQCFPRLYHVFSEFIFQPKNLCRNCCQFFHGDVGQWDHHQINTPALPRLNFSWAQVRFQFWRQIWRAKTATKDPKPTKRPQNWDSLVKVPGKMKSNKKTFASSQIGPCLAGELTQGLLFTIVTTWIVYHFVCQMLFGKQIKDHRSIVLWVKFKNQLRS